MPCWPVLALLAAAPPAVPDGVPEFLVPGHEEPLRRLRELFWLHYPGAGPKATLWDEWLSRCALWPAVPGTSETMREQWDAVLSARGIDPDGYVWTHQHASIAHQHGWPFPFWGQGGDAGVWGWHFSLQHIPPGWGPAQANGTAGWTLAGGEATNVDERAWNLELTAPGATLTTPELRLEPFQSPFVQLRWVARGLDQANPYLEWTSDEAPEFDPSRRVYFEPAGEALTFTMIPLDRHPLWSGTIRRLRLGFDNAGPASVGIQALFTQYDTRHNINNSNFVRGCATYFAWTRDLHFLRRNLPRVRLALRYAMTELGGLREKGIVAPWTGHDGRSGVVYNAAGQKEIRAGHGIGNNYWDLLPAGYHDFYATYQYYDALLAVAELEEQIAAHPEWNLPGGADAFLADELRVHAAEVRDDARQRFWNAETGRFGFGRDADGVLHDYGYTFLNGEAITYDIASNEQAESILSWLSGERTVAGDTSQGDDIYHWRFGPRASTRRNIDWYGWYWSGPESIPWGYQVQDGGGVLGFAYYDLMARLRVRGPDDAWRRLRAMCDWFAEVQAAGGYRPYYAADAARGSLQGGGTAGGLGLDQEFFESALVPNFLLDGLLGFRAHADGFGIEPRLPADWPTLTITRIRFQTLILSVTAGRDAITITAEGEALPGTRLYLPAGAWRLDDAAGAREVEGPAAVPVSLGGGAATLRRR